MKQQSILNYIQTEKKTLNPIQRLMSDDRTQKIHHNGSKFIYSSEQTKMTGITRMLKKIFYSNYKPIKSKRSKRSNIDIGNKVHRQIYHMVHCLQNQNKCNCTIRTSCKKLHKYTLQALQVFKDLEFTCKASEVPIISEENKICTQIDLLGYRWYEQKNERSVHISIKTGYGPNYDINRLEQYLSSPLQEVLSTPRNHNRLQLLCERLILEKEYNIYFDDYIIIYLGQGITQTLTKIDDLDEWTICKSKKNRGKMWEKINELTKKNL